MNYNHSFHAGNFADIMKHRALILLLEKLNEKPTPYFVLDTHAGQGLYDLYNDKAQRTGEAEAGVKRFIRVRRDDLLYASYFQCLQSVNNSEDLRFYPGSPKISQYFMRPQDRLCLAELQPACFKTLNYLFENDRRVTMNNTDGYGLLKSVLPPREGRGLIVIDPPYEQRDEWEKIVTYVGEALKRFSHGIYMIWYPIKDYHNFQEFTTELKQVAPRHIILNCEFKLDASDSLASLGGSGLIIINPPWQFQEKITYILQDILAALYYENWGSIDVEIL